MDAEWSRVPGAGDTLPRLYARSIEQRMERGDGLFLFGGFGSGKSSVAALIAAEAVKLDTPIRWWSFADLMVALEDRWQRADVLRNLSFVRLLVLDDFGSAMLTAEYEQWLDQIVERRYQKRRSVVVTSNLTPVEVAKMPQFGRVADRWKQVTKSYDMVRGSQRDRLDVSDW